MTDEEQARQDRQMADLVAWGEKTQAIAEDLMAKDPSLPYMTATIIANDVMSADLRTQEVEAGRDPKDVVWLVGSFARWGWAVAMVSAGKLDADWFSENIADLWRGSDPDDTDPANLNIWRRSFAQRGGIIRDGRPLPRKGKDGMITVFRGGNPATVGKGFAWTTDPKIAKKFARTHGTRQAMPNGVVISGLVRPLNCLAYLTGRGESEVIVDPRLITDIHQVGEFR